MHKTIPFLAISLAAFSGCSMAPDYSRPEVPLNVTAIGNDAATSRISELSWSNFVSDSYLRELIQCALDNNKDLKIAVLNVENTRALYRIQRSDRFPSIAATGSGSRQRTPWDLSSSGTSVTGSSYQVGASASYEIDLFGRIASLDENALETYLATEESSRSVEISLISSVAQQYFLYIATAEQLSLAESSLENANHLLELNRSMFAQGTSSELDLRTAESQREAYQISAEQLQQTLTTARNALELLVGTSLPTIDTLPSMQDMPVISSFPENIPSEVLLQRPDILAAEHQLKAANANIGAARAAFFPSVSLTAFGGTASRELSGLFENGSGMWSFAPSVRIPIFEAGANKAQLDVAKISTEIQVATYEQAIQSAFRDVADCLAINGSMERQLDAQLIQLKAAERRYELSLERFKAGLDSYLPLLQAQQDLFGAQQNLISLRRQKAANSVSMYAALGGTWGSTAP